jgi:sialate O-acetylesterase
MMIPLPKTLLHFALPFLLIVEGSTQDQPTRGEDFVRAPAIAEGLCVSNAFQSNMVLQRDKPLKIWGWAAPGEKVSVSFAGKSATATANEGRAWQVQLEAIPATATPGRLMIQGKDKTLELDNILVGDVWVLGGQSNMEFAISKVDDGQLEIVSANFPQIRLLTLPQGKGFDSVESFERLHEWSDWSSRHFAKGDWEVCSPETIPEFSAIGYVFGRRLAMASGVPIGLIDASVGGTTVETWTPQERIEKVDGQETQDMLKQWAEKIAAYDPQADLDKRMENYERNKANRAKQGDPLPEDSKPPSDLRPGPVADKNRPGYCYASMIRPLEGLVVKGAVFHQGFNNCFNGSAGAQMYHQVFGEMITAWRSAFADPQLPFCIISLCTAGEPQTWENFAKPMYDVGPLIREAQHKTYRELQAKEDQQIGFVSSFDYRKSWYHPQIKTPVGERAAKWALVTQYEAITGRDAILHWQPPTIKETKIEDGTIRLTMSTDMKTADDSDGKMLGFAIAGDDRRFYPAEISYYTDGSVDNRKQPKYQRNVLVLSSPFVAEPTHYRYAWARNPMANLVNRFGIPLATQRSDDWILEETPNKIPAPEGMDSGSIARWMGNQQKKELENADIERRLREAEAAVSELTPLVEKAAADAARKK